jgi:hypothetical protein
VVLGTVFDGGMFGGNQNVQGLAVAADNRLPPIWFAFGHFIVEPTIGVPPTYFDLLAAPPGDRGQAFQRAVNPFILNPGVGGLS